MSKPILIHVPSKLLIESPRMIIIANVNKLIKKVQLYLDEQWMLQTFQIKFIIQMIENSPIKHKTIYNSFSKLQRASSDGKFRVKSIRVKTVSNQIEDHITQKLGLPLIYPNQSQKKITSASPKAFDSPSKSGGNKHLKQSAKNVKIIEKNYEQQLNKFGVTSDFLRKLYELKSVQNENKLNEQRFLIFIKNFALRLCKNKNLVINQLGFGTKCLRYFLNWFVQWQGHITELDLTYAADMLKEQKMEIIKKLLQIDEKIMSIILCNSGITGEEIEVIFRIINTRQQLFSLDLSNTNSQSLNRFGEDVRIMEKFVKENQSVAILKLNNTQLKQQGFEQIWKGVSQRRLNPLKVLSIASNYIVGSKIVGQQFHGLTKSGLLYLNISQNPLGDEFYKNLSVLKSTTIKQLDLSATGMSSQQFYQFLSKIEESKSLSTLKVDKNDFSHHWFSKIGERLETNNSLEWLSMNDCQIKSFMSIFEGLTQNKYLKKIHANNNAVDFDNQMIKRINDCFVFNKDLQELRIRFCNLNDQILIKLFDSIAENKKLKIIDVSQNLMEDGGAESILKMLEKNYKIQYLGIEKLQFSQNLRVKIQHKMDENKSLRERQQLVTLEGISKDMRSIDHFTWEDVQSYENQCRMLQQKFKIAQKKVAKLEDIASKKRQKVIFYTKEVKAAQKQIELSIKEKIRQENDRVRKAERQSSELEKMENKLKIQCSKEVESINRLQENIKKVNEKIKKRQNELQQIYRNHKYLQKKKKSKDIIDYSPQRRASVGHNHGKQNKN